MLLKNYTSTVPIERTIARIEQVLAQAGACSISKDYAPGGRLAAITFHIELPNRRLAVRLPADSDKVYQSLAAEVKKPHRGTLDRLREQSGRTAWKLMQDWVEVQLSLIKMQQADFIQVFLPYVWDGEQTFYQQLKGGNFKQLPESTT